MAYFESGKELNVEKYTTANDIFSSSNATFSYVNLYKSGHVIDLSFMTNQMAITAGNWTVIGTLKEKFSPESTHMLFFVSNSDARAFQAKIDSTGKISIWSASAVSHPVAGCITFVN